MSSSKGISDTIKTVQVDPAVEAAAQRFTQSPDYSSIIHQQVETPNYIGQQMQPNMGDWQSFFAARYGQPLVNQPSVSSQNPMASGQIGSNVGLGQSIMARLK